MPLTQSVVFRLVIVGSTFAHPRIVVHPGGQYAGVLIVLPVLTAMAIGFLRSVPHVVQEH